MSTFQVLNFGCRASQADGAALKRQLLDAGLAQANISTVGLCTACRTDLFFSYRAEKGHTGRQMGVAGIRP